MRAALLRDLQLEAMLATAPPSSKKWPGIHYRNQSIVTLILQVLFNTLISPLNSLPWVINGG